VLLILGCLGYLLRLFGGVLDPSFNDLPAVGYTSIPGSVGEIGICLWLLLFGARVSLTHRRPG
jgi:hypothetical protein